MKKTFLISQAVLLLTFISLLAGNSAKVYSDLTGEISGTVVDSATGEGLSFANIVLTNDTGKRLYSCTADLDGNYKMSFISPGNYLLKVAALGYKQAEECVIILPGQKITKPIKLRQSEVNLSEVVVTSSYLVAKDQTAEKKVVSNGQVQTISVTRTNPNSINGSREYSQKYYIDGVQINGGYAAPTNSGNISAGILNPKYKKNQNNSSNATILYSAPVYTNEEYAPLIENEFKAVKDEALSTFSIDVDDASYTNFRRYVNNGMLPPKDAIRIEEFINFFSYKYSQPTDEHPFSIAMEQATCPWNTAHQLVGIGIKGREIAMDNVPPCNLVFLIDVSGSMESPDKLMLVKSCFKLLVKQLRTQDKVSIVVYAGSSGLVLPPTSGLYKDKINTAIDNLEAGGSTAGGAGIELAYKTAKGTFIQGGNNRVILATDGDFNVGVSSEADLIALIESKRDDGIFLTTLGFGQGNYKDAKMELLADKGNGNYSYVDSYQQGKRVFSEQLTSTLLTIAKDVKFQIEFNPSNVKGYRLIGYENRMLNKEDFNNDKKDAGEIGAGHTVTAFYEIIPAGSPEIISSVDSLKYQFVAPQSGASADDLLTLKMRYKRPDQNVSILMVRPLKKGNLDIQSCSEDFRFAAAVAEFSIVLRESKFKGNASFKDAIELAKTNKGTDADGSRAEFIQLATTASELAGTKTTSSK